MTLLWVASALCDAAARMRKLEGWADVKVPTGALDPRSLAKAGEAERKAA